MNSQQIRDAFNAIPAPPIAIEALWDGDSTGWFIRLNAIMPDQESIPLGVLSQGGDIRLFNGQVPPWPEAVVAQQIGRELAQLCGAEFHFPSPENPELDCPSYADREKGLPCEQCGILLLQGPDCPWRGICYHCHLAMEREKRESKLTLEQRSGPRCHICGNPATGELNGAPACMECMSSYQVIICAQCHTAMLVHNSLGTPSLCSLCELQNAVDSLTPLQRQTIHAALLNGRFDGILAMKTAIKCSPPDAQYALQLFLESNADEGRNNADIQNATVSARSGQFRTRLVPGPRTQPGC